VNASVTALAARRAGPAAARRQSYRDRVTGALEDLAHQDEYRDRTPLEWLIRAGSKYTFEEVTALWAAFREAVCDRDDLALGHAEWSEFYDRDDLGTGTDGCRDQAEQMKAAEADDILTAVVGWEWAWAA
jgi:hypothetical protein